MKILLAEDTEELNRAVTQVLTMQGYETDPVYDGQAAVDHALSGSYDCMIFDIMMPIKDGITALKEIRAAGDVTPVLLLTAKTEIDDRVEGLDAGADDYLSKPFAMKELLARIRSMTRRKSSYTPTDLTIGSVKLSVSEQELSARNSIRLSNKESRLMEYLMLNVGKELSTETLFSHVWDQESIEGDPADAVWIYISYLRQKLMSINADIGIEGMKGDSFVLKDYSVRQEARS
ncbi:MAG: response regulator transcription factor [Lachnospiraceae bacterium]|nr:response regulator transcription factor [Lachnospiraceae bacterium]